MATDDEPGTAAHLLREIGEQCRSWADNGLPAAIAMENIADLLAEYAAAPVSTPVPRAGAGALGEPPIIAWMQAFNEGRRAFNNDRWPDPKPASEHTHNPYDLNLDFTLHYWWERGNQCNASPVDNYRHIPRELINEDVGRSTPPPEPLDKP